MTSPEDSGQYDGSEIAVVGMALRVPGAHTLDEYWANVRDGIESVRPLSDEEMRAAGVSDADRERPNYVAMRAPLDGAKEFDAAFFGFSPRDAALMDPQHRHFLEVSWEALEHAGVDPARFEGAIGVFGGSGHNAYMPYNILTNPDLVDSVGFFLVRHTNNDKDFLVTRVAYALDLHGPAINVQTACSTSLVGIHLGVQSLLNGESDMVLAGGVTIDMPLDHGYLHEEGEILSNDGHCRPFDAESSGTVFGSGAGVVVLKRLDDALADRDTIHAVIRGTAVNNDGSNKVGYLAPSVDGQSAAVGEAIAVADVDPRTIGFIECHGTGTEIGDPIEVAALTQAFRAHNDDNRYCALGSVKSNIGHLDTAAGIAGFIKACLALTHKTIPPTVHFTEPNPRIDFENSPFFVNGEALPWETDGAPRRAGVSSLGVGGTNAHVILEEAPSPSPSGESRPWQLLPISAKDPTALEDATTRLGGFLTAHPEVDLADVAHTLQSGRQPLDVRRFAVVRDHADAAAVLSGEQPKRLQTGTAAVKRRSVVFMFPGQGAQYANMGRDLYEQEPVFRDGVDECAAILEPLMGLDLRTLLFCDETQLEHANEHLARTTVTQPATFVIEYAMARLWMSWGIEPSALIGHSLGEYAAACLAGVFTLPDALAVVVARGRLMDEMPAGSMMVVPQSAAVVEGYLRDGLALGAINGPEFSVVSGPDDAVDALEAQLIADDVEVRRLHISIASHSSLMDPMLAPFTEVVAATRLRAPTIPYVSNVSGTWITAEQATDPGYYASHVRTAVDFMGGLQTILAADEERCLLEVGPGRTLTTFARQLDGPHRKTLSTSMRHATADGDDLAMALSAMGELWAAGAIDDWAPFVGDEARSRVAIPTYPFQHQEFWIEPGESTTPVGTPSLAKQADLDDWFHVPGWSQTPPPANANPTAAEAAEWLIFLDDDGVGTRLAETLRAHGRVTTVVRGTDFATANDEFVIDPGDPAHYTRLVRALRDDGRVPTAIVYLPALSQRGVPPLDAPDLSRAHTDAFYGQLALAQALAADIDGVPIDWWVVSHGLHDVSGEGSRNPLQALALGPVRVIGQENPHITCRNVDIGPFGGDDRQMASVVDALANEVRSAPDDVVIAHRGRRRWVQTRIATALGEANETADLLRERGVYLITGGTGGLGLELAEHLATSINARLALISRTPIPPRDARDQWLADHRRDDAVSRTIRRVQAMEAVGAEVEVIAADVTDLEQVSAAVASIQERFGTVNGVIHAAGRLSDQLIAVKDPADAAAVLAPKVLGTLVLEAALDGVDLDFMALFSSVSAITGPAGQIDYAAANAFLDAYARHRNAIEDRVTVAIGWGPWTDVGMTVRTAVDLGLVDELAHADSAPTSHALLDRSYETAEADVFETDMSPARQWVLDEHRTLAGLGLMPGTGYLDVMVATQDLRRVEGAIELSNVFFMAPFLVADDDSVTLRVSIPLDGEDFVISSSAAGATQEHVRGQVQALEPTAPAPIALDEIVARCGARVEEYEHYDNPQLRWGPRWNVLRKVAFGTEEALATLSLRPEFADDLTEHRLHPAILDLATGGALGLIPGFVPTEDFFVPFSYGRLRLHDAFTSEVFSHIRLRPQQDSDTAVFDITVVDSRGAVLLEVDGFVMRRATGEIAAESAPTENALAPTSPLMDSLANAITPDEGVRAFRRVLSESLLPEITVVAQDLHALIEDTRTSRLDDPATAGAPTHERPDVSTPYVAPESERETAIAAIWEEMLGVEGIGVHDDFFELGGHSLLLTQAITRTKKISTAEVSLFVLFEAPTISEQVAEIEKAEAEQGSADRAPTPTLGRVSRDKYRTQVGALRPKGAKEEE